MSFQRRNVVLVLGAPGSGKGTLCKRLSEHFNLVFFSAGELVRRVRDPKLDVDNDFSELAHHRQTILEYDRKGTLLPGSLVIQIMETYILKYPSHTLFLIDGFPRTPENLIAFNEWQCVRVLGVLVLDCPDRVSEERILHRAAESGRWEDRDLATIRTRLHSYHDLSECAVRAYEQRGLVHRIDATRAIEAVTRDAIRALQLMRLFRRRSASAWLLKIAFTGGPCGGKTTAVQKLTRYLEGKGFNVVRVPEVATLLFGAGASLTGLSMSEVADWEEALLDLQLQLEDTLEKMAALTRMPSVLLCDRGTMDICAHLPPAVWAKLLEKRSMTQESACGLRYDIVYHIVSAAVAHPELYNTDNNPQRSNGLTYARQLDLRCQEAWVSHPCRHTIPIAETLEEKLRGLEASIGALIKPYLPPPLPIRVLLTAEAFGFGPSAAIAQVFHWLRPLVQTLSYAGTGHTLDIQRLLPYDNVHLLGDAVGQSFADVCKGYDAVLTSCDFPAAEASLAAGIPTAIYDPLTWYHKTLPPVSVKCSLYIAQDFFDVRDRLAGNDFHAVAVVPPLVPYSLPSLARLRDDSAVVNLGGLQNPLLSTAFCQQYARILASVFVPRAQAHYRSVSTISSASIVEALQDDIPEARTVSPPEAQRLIARSKIAVMTPGLGNIYEAAALSARVFWLPPANDSQGQQLRILQRRNLAPVSADWHELLGPDLFPEPIDYFGPQADVMRRIAAAIQAAAANADAFCARLGAKFEKVLQTPFTENTALHTITEQFGLGGDQTIASALYKQVLFPIVKRRTWGDNDAGDKAADA